MIHGLESEAIGIDERARDASDVHFLLVYLLIDGENSFAFYSSRRGITSVNNFVMRQTILLTHVGTSGRLWELRGKNGVQRAFRPRDR